jgi:hypothetical protein
MKARTFLSLAVAVVGVTSAGLAGKYDDLASQGYRWVTVDGPWGCTTVGDLQEIAKSHGGEKELEMVEQLRAYYLTPGTIVQVVHEDAGAGMSQIRISGVNRILWTFSRFLSRRPVSDVYGVIETPQQSGMMANPSVTPMPDQSATLSASPTSSGSPEASASPVIHAKPRRHGAHRAQ